MDLPEAKGSLILTPLCTSALFYTYFSYLKLHKKERSQKKNLRSHQAIELGTSYNEGRAITDCADPFKRNWKVHKLKLTYHPSWQEDKSHLLKGTLTCSKKYYIYIYNQETKANDNKGNIKINEEKFILIQDCCSADTFWPCLWVCKSRRKEFKIKLSQKLVT